MAALVAVNAIGDVIDPTTGRSIAGARTPTASHHLVQHRARPARAASCRQRLLAGMATTIGVVATDAMLDKAQAEQAGAAWRTTAWRAASTRCTR